LSCRIWKFASRSWKGAHDERRRMALSRRIEKLEEGLGDEGRFARLHFAGGDSEVIDLGNGEATAAQRRLFIACLHPASADELDLQKKILSCTAVEGVVAPRFADFIRALLPKSDAADSDGTVPGSVPLGSTGCSDDRLHQPQFMIRYQQPVADPSK
jgi:hypothetical protein